ncbi:MAG: amidohydrolase family protein [Arenicellaceae bacterium]|nr:amidohydrolase family protein [Arenicellaceae bacterium]
MHRIINSRSYFQKAAVVASLLTLLALSACGQSTEQTAETATEPADAAPSTVVLYEGARIIVGDGSDPIQNGAFTVDGGQFVAIGAAGDVSAPDGATRVDLSGKTVMPTIVDAHTHLSVTREELLDDLQRRALFGVSATLSMGADGPGAPLEMRDEVIPGAALYRSAGHGITAPELGRREVHWVTNEEEAREAVRTEIARNVDVIKLWVDDRDGQYDKLSPEIYSAAIDEAHQNNVRVSAHLFDLADAKGLVLAGVDIFAHGVRDMDVDEEFVEMVKARPNLVLIPNLRARGVATDLDWLTGLISDQMLVDLQGNNVKNPEIQEAYNIQARNLARLNNEDMTITVGTDGNRPWGPHVEMEDMVASGMTPAQVLVAATRNGAALLELGDTGTIEADKNADFIVLNANPLDDITNTRQISSVFLRGEEVDRAEISARWLGM